MNTNKIPQIIHSCWFGRGEKPKKIIMCMTSWKTHLSDYEFIEWNEENFDITSNPYVQQAYEAGKYAFVSDYVRLFALYQYGGIYMDTDVEVLKPLDRFLQHEAFSGFEDEKHVSTGIMGSAKQHEWSKQLLEYYTDIQFLQPDGSFNFTTNTAIITRNCMQHGLIANNQFQQLKNGLTLYPRTYFSPYDYINGASYLTDDSYTIHHFAKTWLPAHVRYRGELKRIVSRLMGPSFISTMRKIVNKI